MTASHSYINTRGVMYAISNISNYVCWEFVGMLPGYADDLTLICPSFPSTVEIVNICTIFATDFPVTFNNEIW